MNQQPPNHELNQQPNNTDPPQTGENREILDQDTPSIWVGSLSDYNNGILHGAWINADQPENAIWQQIRKILETSPTERDTGQPAEEWAVFDYDNFHGLHIDEYENITTVNKIAQLITKHGEPFALWADDNGIQAATSDDAEEQFLNAYIGHYQTKQEYTQQLIDDLGIEQQLDQLNLGNLRYYITIDYDTLTQDLQLNGDITLLPSQNGGYHAYQT